MRLQLVLVAFLFLCFQAWSQEEKKKSKKKDIDVNWLNSYYQQDGDNSAVTGGEGPQELKDFASILIVKIPRDSLRSWTLNGAVNYYTSASNDNIDFRESSASRHEWRGDFEMTYSWDRADQVVSRSVTAGVSVDVDYLSTWIGGHWAKDYNKGMSQLYLKGRFFFDRWYQVIYPIELRGQDWVDTDLRQTLSLYANYARIVNKRTQVSFNPELVYQHGLLSIPFHRVYFDGGQEVRVERLPDTRFKLPVSVRLNYYAFDFLVIRSYYRYYWDTWGIQGHTFSLETPIQVSPFFSFYPLFRYHYQTAADYFAPFGEFTDEDEYYTSNYDLSEFHALKYGGGFKYSPLRGLMRFKQAKWDKYTMFKSIEFRFAYYDRSDGLHFWTVSSDFGFTF